MSETNDKKPEKSFLEALPKIITAIATLVTAIALILAIPQIADRLFPPEPTPVVAPSSSPSEDGVDKPPTALPSVVSPTDDTSPIVQDFQTCETLCNGTNSLDSFSEGIKKVYAQFNYANFQPGDKYVRIWSLNGMEWIKYTCSWDGPVSGTEIITLKEPKGLHSGTWEITIFVNDEVVLKDQMTVNGNWTYWDPAGTIYACHGTTD